MKFSTAFFTFLATVVFASSFVHAQDDLDTKNPKNVSSYESGAIDKASVYFVTPKDGATVKSPFKVKFAVKGLKVAKAGAVIPGTGHHHLLIDAGPMAQEGVPKGTVVPKDATHLHFGDGASETTVTLPPGKHTLTLQFADGAHASYGKSLSATITVTVQ